MLNKNPHLTAFTLKYYFTELQKKANPYVRAVLCFVTDILPITCHKIDWKAGEISASGINEKEINEKEKLSFLDLMSLLSSCETLSLKMSFVLFGFVC